MAENLIELGLEGFDRLVDKYHDRAYDTATDSAGKVWKKVHLPGRQKSVYVEQNPNKGERAEIYDPAKDERPQGFKKDKASDRGSGKNSPHPVDQSTYSDDYRFDHGFRESHRGPVNISERDRFGSDDPDSSRKPYPSELPSDARVAYSPQVPRSTYFQPQPRDDHGISPTASLDHRTSRGRYRASEAGAVIERDQRRSESRGYSLREPSPNYLRRQRSYDARLRCEGTDSGSSLPRRRRARSAAPQDRSSFRRHARSRSRTYGQDKRRSRDYYLGASLAGAVAGGLIGRSLGKGDLISTVAGGLVGAIGGDIIADKEPRRNRSGNYSEDRYRAKKNSDNADKDYSNDYVYKDRY
ncbi:hypothetical protein, variant [Verruconis gallopava]|uniref:Glycine zipper 2TM domain-containing protein n=1 Tax=Verruconis gallopava TaxID=253628 RepID=A0A0D1Z819_9PEZI|nr:uncharacterized protein PV09_00032 [Verruconis gallopava]XP_016218956.1 hypothetical protein, variant [Verruconis gallopava]KIW09086.1 hypothetical protein PV09_00032 [Verruconis gallopava]KIW09087.1 hypothetical protein, variant [Verruconis gallopava]